MAASSPRRSTRAAVQKATVTKKTAVTKTRPSRSAASTKTAAYLDKVPSSEDDIELESENNSDLEVESDSEEEVEEEEDISSSQSDKSEDDREIRRIIEKTAAETKNIPLTARQRAAKQAEKSKEADEDQEEKEQVFLSLPMSKPLSEEQMLLKSEKSRRRKMQREQKLEETKRATIERLLTKQRGAASDKASEETDEGVESVENLNDNSIPSGCIRFIDRANDTFLVIPVGENCFSPPPTPLVRPTEICAVCKKCPRKYTHPTTGKPFCSLTCFKAL